MTYHFEVHKEDDVYWGECKELDSCVSEGKNIEELRTHLQEALEGVLSVDFQGKFAHSLPNPALSDNNAYIRITVSPEVAFMVYLRAYRHNKKLTQNQMKDALGMKSRNSYVKLERQGNPTFKTAGRILKAFPDFPIEECFDRVVHMH